MLLSKLTGNRDNNFNLIRFIAATSVLINHCFPLLGYKEVFGESLGITIGTFAVDIFFLSSGFLVTNSLFRSATTSDYILSRTLRIFPALIILTILSVVLLGSFFTSLPLLSYFHHIDTKLFLLKGMTVVAGIPMQLPGVFDNNKINAVNGSLWTILYEIKMYLLLLLIYIASKNLNSKLNLRYNFFLKLVNLNNIIVVLALVSGLNLIASDWHIRPSCNLTRFIFMFFTGSAFYIFREKIKLNTFAFFCAISALLIAGFAEKEIFLTAYCFTCAYILFYLAYIPTGIIRQFNKLGDYSYGIYIYAFPVQQSVVALFPNISILGMALISFFVTVCCAIFSWHLIEKPSLKAKERIIAKLKHGRNGVG